MKVAFSLNSTVSFREFETTLPSWDGGEPINNTTHFNITFVTKRPNDLIEHGPMNFTALVDTLTFTEIQSLINREGSVTVRLADGGTIDWFAYLRSVTPQQGVRGQALQIQGVIEITNWDPANFLEVGPVVTNVTGT